MGRIREQHVHRVLGLLEGKADGSHPVSLGDVMDFASASAESFQQAIGGTDVDACLALASIGAEINAMKTEISRLQFQDVREHRIPEAGHELDAIVEATEEATNTIMEAAEAIMAADPSEHAAFAALVSDKVVEIFEACSFQDITGQRISKVVQTIDHIDKRVASFIEQLRLLSPDGEAVEESLEERRRRELILHGPQRKGEGVSQGDVDKMLCGSDEVGQSDIDDLFK